MLLTHITSMQDKGSALYASLRKASFCRGADIIRPQNKAAGRLIENLIKKM